MFSTGISDDFRGRVYNWGFRISRVSIDLCGNSRECYHHWKFCISGMFLINGCEDSNGCQFYWK